MTLSLEAPRQAADRPAAAPADDYERFVRAHAAEAWALARCLTRDADVARQWVQQAVHAAWGTEDPVSVLRRSLLRAAIGAPEDAAAPEPARDLRSRVRHEIEHLPEPARTALRLRDGAGLAIEEMAALLEHPPHEIRQAVHSARLLLRARLDALADAP